jgi:hypothetical protein
LDHGGDSIKADPCARREPKQSTVAKVIFQKDKKARSDAKCHQGPEAGKFSKRRHAGLARGFEIG